jgi:hypothetical protein
MPPTDFLAAVTAADGSDALTEGLRAIAQRCCRQTLRHKNTAVVNVQIGITPLTLARVVADAATRVAGIVGVRPYLGNDFRGSEDCPAVCSSMAPVQGSF